MKLQTQNDQDLIHAYIGGHEPSLEELVRRHKAKIYTSIYLLVKDQYLAEDIFQDTFIKVINTLKAGKYNEEGKFLPWVMRIAHNLVIDHFRREKRTPVITNVDGFDIFDVIKIYDESMEERMVREQTHKDLKAMIHLLPSEQKEVLIMRQHQYRSGADALRFKQFAQNDAGKRAGNKELIGDQKKEMRGKILN